MLRTTFISRDAPFNSPFAARLRAAGWQVRGQSLVVLAPVPVLEIPEADWIFFASANAVRFYPTPDLSASGEGLGVAALGPATARAVLARFGRIDFSGDGNPATTAAAFARLAEGQKVLFPAARNTQKSIARLLGDRIEAIHLVVYDNAPLPDPPRCDEAVLVFTSPMNAQAYFSRHPLQRHQRTVAIGPSTAAALAALGCPAAAVAAEASEAGLADAVLGVSG